MSQARSALVPMPPPQSAGGSAYGDDEDEEECTDELIDRILENYRFHFKPETRIKLKQRCAAQRTRGAAPGSQGRRAPPAAPRAAPERQHAACGHAALRRRAAG